uniref:Uncharacterized LOC100181139 n=1 Tax=Ciona intestinalis TaxID=7719 RepID=A0A1W5B5D2_CIOIN|nr:uncharacterized protein LOC100181139 [Ciona intestinalis]|eukprot:XP_026690368.1 uncharacterized protein LOC100181139 [Ciona intestinalis]
MKTILCFLAVGVVAVATQDASDPQNMQCLVGVSINGEGFFETVDCVNSEEACQTKIEQRGAFNVVYKRCKRQKECDNNARNNELNCYGPLAIANNVKVCHFCCSTPGCNTMNEIPN